MDGTPATGHGPRPVRRRATESNPPRYWPRLVNCQLRGFADVDQIPFNKPFIAGKELHYVAQAVTFGNLGGDGRFTKQCCRVLEDRFGINEVLLVPSCTAALEMAAMLLDLKPGDEVILPSYTFVSTANCVVRMGVKPIFVDIRPDTLNIDDALIEEAITERTRAIFPVHYAGVACEMDRIMTIAEKYGLRVVEDAAAGCQLVLQRPRPRFDRSARLLQLP